MQRNATAAAPGTGRPASHPWSVRNGVSSASANSACVMPKALRAALNSAGDNVAILGHAQVLASKCRVDVVVSPELPERTFQHAIGIVERATLGTIRADADKPESIGGEISGDANFLHWLDLSADTENAPYCVVRQGGNAA